jgi:hypothetical protein
MDVQLPSCVRVPREALPRCCDAAWSCGVRVTGTATCSAAVPHESAAPTPAPAATPPTPEQQQQQQQEQEQEQLWRAVPVPVASSLQESSDLARSGRRLRGWLLPPLLHPHHDHMTTFPTLWSSSSSSSSSDGDSSSSSSMDDGSGTHFSVTSIECMTPQEELRIPLQ